MKNSYLILMAIFIAISPLFGNNWDFDNGLFANGEISSTTTINGLTMHATVELNMHIENHSLGSYSKRLKFNGGGNFVNPTTPNGRVLSFNVDGDAIIKVATTSNGGPRILVVAAGSNASILKEVDAPEGSLNVEEVQYTGPATTIYIYSKSGGVNVYAVSVIDSFDTDPVLGDDLTSANPDLSKISVSYRQAPMGIRTFYIATNGNNNNSGTMDAPFASLAKAASIAQPGDVFIVRGGVYHHPSKITFASTRSGTQANPITVIAYPGEIPTLDFSQQIEQSGYDGLRIDASYWHIIGIHLRHAGANGFRIHGSSNLLEMCVAYRNRLTGFHLEGRDGQLRASNNLIKNCDSFQNFNFRGRVGNMADGFTAKYEIGPGNHFYGCRSWNNSDDGFDFWRATETVRVENCWVFGNGDRAIFEEIFKDDAVKLAIVIAEFDGGGNGLKMGGDHQPGPHYVTRCLAFDNKGKGYDHNNNTGAMTFIHNTAYNNDRNFVFPNNPESGQAVFQNNLSHKSSVLAQTPSNALRQGNSWQSGNTVTDALFESVNTNLAISPRQEDGSLPNISLLKPVPGSFIIDGGVDIGQPFVGAAPDMGAYEYNNTPTNMVIAELDLTPVFAVYPNPVSNGIVNIKAGINFDYAVIKLIDLNGSFVFERPVQNFTETSINISAKPGIYILQIIADNINTHQKVIVR